jgi:photoactive yellow protein
MTDREGVFRALSMPIEKFDELPFGAIVIDASGTVIEYNQYESKLSHLQRERVLGRNFFHDIAPCTAVQAFEGRLKAFVKLRDRVSETFHYFFAFAHGPIDVQITFLKLAGEHEGQILIAVEHEVALPPLGGDGS